ncbi:Cilia- and flagella-associated protein 251, partial [Nowakowskiella sp. JEL0078]
NSQAATPKSEKEKNGSSCEKFDKSSIHGFNANVTSYKIEKILEQQFDTVSGLALHPKKSLFAVGGHCGMLQIWDYTSKELLNSKKFEENLLSSNIQLKKQNNEEDTSKEKSIHSTTKNKIQCVSFSPSGNILVLGFTNGTVKLLNGENLEDLDGASVWNISSGKYSITKFAFSNDGIYLAIADEGFGVSLFQYELKEQSIPVFAAPHKPGAGIGINDNSEVPLALKSKVKEMQWTHIGR